MTEMGIQPYFDAYEVLIYHSDFNYRNKQNKTFN